MATCNWPFGARLVIPVLLSVLSESAHSALVVTRPPYLQSATSNGLQIIWCTSVPATTMIEYGTTTNLGLSLADSTLVRTHVVVLTNLLPDTEYHYRIASNDGSSNFVSNLTAFRTFRMSGPLAFTVVGDSGSRDANEAAIERALERVPADLLVHLGDMVNWGSREDDFDQDLFAYYQDLLCRTPFFPVIGNHDWPAWSSVFYLPTNNIDGTYGMYSFDHGDVHFAVDSFANSNSLVWLDLDLAASSKPWKLFFRHYPVASSGMYAGSSSTMTNLLAIMARRGAQLFLASHDHNYQRFIPTNGVHHLVSGGGGRLLYPFTQAHAAYCQFGWLFHFLRVAITNEVLKVEAIDANGVVFDRLTICTSLPPSRLYSSTWHTPAWRDEPANDMDGNIVLQRFDFRGDPIYTRAGACANLGLVYVNNDATNLYLGLSQVMQYANNNVFLFVESPRLSGVTTMAGVGNGVLDPFDQGVDGLDCLENLSFTNFTPSIGAVLGDEYADGATRSFVRANLTLDIGQGVYRLDANLSHVAGVRLQQFNRSPQRYEAAPGYLGYDREQNADLITLAIPLAVLGHLQPADIIKIAAVVGGGMVDVAAQARELDSAALAVAMTGSGLTNVVLEGVSVRLAADPSMRMAVTIITNAACLLTWNAEPGRRYDLEVAERLPNFTRLDAPGLPLTASSGTASFVVPMAGNTQRFYRVRLLP